MSKIKKNRMKDFNIYILVLAFLSIGSVYSQQDSYYTLYKYNMNIINPAYSGVQPSTDINMGFRMQWIGVEGAPKTQFLSVTKPINDKIGIGFSVVNDDVFILKQTDASIDVSYHLNLNESTLLYFGLKGGGSFVDINLDKVGVVNDPLFTENQSFFNPTLGAGFYVKNKRWYASLSTPNFLSGDRYEKEGNVPVAATDAMHLYVGGGYTWDLNSKISFTPSIMMRYVTGAPSSYDVSGTFDFSQKASVGLNYRLEESVAVFGMIKVIDQLHFGLSYEYSVMNQISSYSDVGTMEVLLRFRFL